MNNSFSSDQIAKTRDLKVDWITRQNELAKMAKFIAIKSINPKLKQPEVATELKYSSFTTIQRYRRETNML